MNLKEGRFSIIKFYPNCTRDESVNLGVILEDIGKVNWYNFDKYKYNLFKSTFNSKDYGDVLSDLFNCIDKNDLEFLNSYFDKFIKVSEPRNILYESVDSELIKLSKVFVTL